MTAVIAFMNTSGLSTFKLLAWVLNRGVLAESWLTSGQFAALYNLTLIPAPAAVKEKDDEPAAGAPSAPIKTKTPKTPSFTPPATLQRLILSKIAGLFIAVPIYALYISALPRVLAVFLQGVCQYLSMSLFMDICALAVWMFLGLRCAPHFRNPYASTSPSEFWNKRWNLPVSQAFRAVVYDPLVEGQWIKTRQHVPREEGKGTAAAAAAGAANLASSAAGADRVPERSTKTEEEPLIWSKHRRGRHGIARGWEIHFSSKLWRLIGVVAVFFVSGVYHELMYMYLTGTFTRSFTWLKYFMLWGLIVVTEKAVKHPLRRSGVIMPTWLGWLVTIIITHTLVGEMWWRPAEEAGMPQQAMKNVEQVVGAMDGLIEGFTKMFRLQEAQD